MEITQWVYKKLNLLFIYFCFLLPSYFGILSWWNYSGDADGYKYIFSPLV